MWRDTYGEDAMLRIRRARRRDRAREAVVLANENLYAEEIERAMKWAKRAVRLQPRSPAAHAAWAYSINEVDAEEHFAINPWLASFTPEGGEAWLQR